MAEQGTTEQLEEHGPEKTRSPVTALVIGLVAGFLSVLLGVGGGSFMVPALVLLLNLRAPRAVGTALAAVVPSAALGVWAYAENPAVHLDGWAVAELAAGNVIGALGGALLARRIAIHPLRRYLGVGVVVTGMVMVFQATRLAELGVAPGEAPHYPWLALAAAGGVAGLLGVLLGFGGGAVMVPLLVLGLGYPEKLAQGLSLGVVVPVALSGALGHCRRGNIVPLLATWLAVGAVIGVAVTGWWVQRLSDPILRTLFGALLVLFGVSMVANKGRR
jgi:uncharacterized membrane protein YfcA